MANYLGKIRDNSTRYHLRCSTCGEEYWARDDATPCEDNHATLDNDVLAVVTPDNLYLGGGTRVSFGDATGRACIVPGKKGMRVVIHKVRVSGGLTDDVAEELCAEFGLNTSKLAFALVFGGCAESTRCPL